MTQDLVTTLRRYPNTTVAWTFISLVIMLVHLALPRTFAFDLTALLLAVIAAIYVGFALQDGRPLILVQEVTAAAVFVLFAALGLWVSPYLWALGLALHGVWDWLHHPQGVQTQVPDYYPPVCVVVDWSLAVFLLIWL